MIIERLKLACSYIKKPNVFLLRKVIGSKYFTKVLTLEIRSGWSKREYKNEAKKELVKWLENINK